MQNKLFDSLPEFAKYDSEPKPAPVNTPQVQRQLGQAGIDAVQKFNKQHRDSYVGDLINSAQSGFYDTIGDVATGTRQLLTDNPQPNRFEKSMRKAADINRDSVDPQRLSEMQQWGFGEDDDITLSNTGMQLANVAGSFLPSMVPGGALAKAAQVGTKVVGLGSKAQKLAEAAGYALSGMPLIGGSAANEVSETLRNMPAEQLSVLAAKQGMLPEDYIYYSEQLASKYGAGIGATSMGIAGPLMGKLALGLGNKSAINRVATGAAAEGAQEAFEEGGQARIVNPLVGRDNWQGVSERALEGGVLGAGAGGVAGSTGAAINKLLPNTGAISNAVNTGTIVNAKQELKAQPSHEDGTLSSQIFADARSQQLIPQTTDLVHPPVDLLQKAQSEPRAEAWAKYDSIAPQPINKTITSLENDPNWSQQNDGSWTDGINILNVDANKLAPHSSEALGSQTEASDGLVIPEKELTRALEISPESQSFSTNILQRNKEVDSILKARHLDNPLNRIIASKIEAMNQDGLDAKEYHSLLSGFADSFNAGVLAAENNEVSNTRSNEDPYYFSGASLIGKDNVQRNEQEQVQLESINPEAFSFYSEKTDAQLNELLKRFGLNAPQGESRDSLINRIIEKEYGQKTKKDFSQYDTAPVQHQPLVNPNFQSQTQQVPLIDFKSPVNQVRNSREAAAVMQAAIGKHAQESMTAVITDDAGNILNVIRHTKGAKDGSSVNPGDLVGAIVSTPQASKVYFSHNHPSGRLDESNADRNITERLNKMLENTHVTSMDHVIIGNQPNRFYSLIDREEKNIDGTDVGLEANSNPESFPLSMTERVFTRSPDPDTQLTISDPQSGRKAVRQMKAESGLIMLSNRHGVIGNLPLSSEEMGELKANNSKALRDVYSAIDSTGAAAVIIKGGETSSAKNLSRFLNAHGDVRLLDRLHKPDGQENWESDAERANGDEVLKASGPYYQKAPAKTTGQTKQELKSNLKKQLGSYRNINIVNQQSELPAHILKDIAPDDVISGVHNPTTNTIYLVANNISADKSSDILRHEVVHGVLKYSPAYQEALRELDKQKGTELYQQAEQAATQAGTKPADMQEEILAYYLQADKKLPFVRRLLSRLKAYLRQYFNIDMSLDDISLLLTDMAKGDVDYGTKMPNGAIKFHAVFHGTPHEIQGQMSTDHIGTGEGAQAQGWGLYFADLKGVAKHYRDKLANGQAIPIDLLRDYFKPGNIIPSYGGQDKVISFEGTSLDDWSAEVIAIGRDGQPVHGVRPRVHSTMPDAKAIKQVTGRQLGNLYGVELKPKQTEYLNWDKPLTQQSKHVRNAITTMGMGSFINSDMTGKDFYHQLVKFYTSEPDSNWMIDKSAAQKQASLELLNAGIRGNKYRDASGKGSYNYVIFDDSDIEITHKFSKKPAKTKPANGERTTAPGVQDASARLNKVINSGSALTDFIKNKKEDWRPALLGTLTLRQLADIGRAYLPQLQDYVELNTKMQTERNAASEEYNKLAETWRKWSARNRAESEQNQSSYPV